MRGSPARRIVVAAAALLSAWALLAYAVLPVLLRHFHHQPALSGTEMVTRTAQGFSGDPLYVGLVGSQSEVVNATHAAGWFAADPVTLRTSLAIVGSVVLDRPYHDAPVSPLFFDGRREDLAFEQPVGVSADRRLHVRLWKVLEEGAEGRPVWLGSASLDTGVGFSHYTGAVTHAISPDVDAARDTLSADLAKAAEVASVYEVSGVGPTLFGRNGEGDRYFTDGEVRISVLATNGQGGLVPPPMLANPPLIQFKNAVWRSMAGSGRGD